MFANTGGPGYLCSARGEFLAGHGGEGLQQVGPVKRRVVHPRAHRVGDHRIGRVWHGRSGWYLVRVVLLVRRFFRLPENNTGTPSVLLQKVERVDTP